MGHNSENCREVFALLSEYLNLELPAEACKQIESHLAECPPCIEFAESLRKTIDLCRSYQSKDMPEPLSEQARAELENAWKRMLST